MFDNEEKFYLRKRKTCCSHFFLEISSFYDHYTHTQKGKWWRIHKYSPLRNVCPFLLEKSWFFLHLRSLCRQTRLLSAFNPFPLTFLFVSSSKFWAHKFCSRISHLYRHHYHEHQHPHRPPSVCLHLISARAWQSWWFRELLCVFSSPFFEFVLLSLHCSCCRLHWFSFPFVLSISHSVPVVFRFLGIQSINPPVVVAKQNTCKDDLWTSGHLLRPAKVTFCSRSSTLSIFLYHSSVICGSFSFECHFYWFGPWINQSGRWIA